MQQPSKLTIYLDIDGTILYDPGDETRREELDYQRVCEGLEKLLHDGIDLRHPFAWFDDDPEERDLSWLERNHRLGSFVQMEPSNPHNPARMLTEIKSRMENC